MSGFDTLDDRIRTFLVSQGMVTPTPIQEKAIPELIKPAHNALLIAPTGSGKTEAALLPLLNRLYDASKQRELFGVYILYVTPLRALNRDVFRRLEQLCHHLGLTVEVRHGDTTQYARRKQAIRPPNLLILTPETLQAVLPARRMQSHLKTVFAIVIDEIHELADSKRGTQLSFGIERLERIIGAPIQRVGLSATVGNPSAVAGILAGPKHHAPTIWAGFQMRKMLLRVEMPVPTSDDETVSKRISYPPHSVARLRRIIELIAGHQSTLVFTNTRSFAEVLGSKMQALNPPYEFDVHHGSLSKDVRLAAEDRLKKGTSRAIVATSSLELGIDIGQADLVIQYSSPRSVSRALQRTGRAGHSLERVAEGVILATENIDDVTESGVILRRARLNKVEAAEIPENSWDVLCHQICGLTLDSGAIDMERVQELVHSSYPFRHFTQDELSVLLSFMTERGLVSVKDGRVDRTSRTRQFYYEHLSTIPDVRQIAAVDMVTRRSIGVLDEDYVEENVGSGTTFVIRGRPYTVVSVEEDEILCAPATQVDTDAHRWIGEMIPVPYEVASEVAEVWNRTVSMTEKEARSWLRRQYRLSDTATAFLIAEARASHEKLGLLPSESHAVLEDIGTGLVLHMPLGTKGSETLGIVLAALLTTREGIDIGVERDPYRILLTASSHIDPEHVVDALKNYNPDQIRAILRLALKNTQTFASRFIHVARRMGVVDRAAKTSEIPVRKLIRAFENTPVYEEAMQEVLREKMDEETAIRQFTKAAEGRLDVTIVQPKEMSPLARSVVEERSRFEVVGEVTEENEILRLMERRLLSRRLRLVCMNCGWTSARTISTLDEEVVCPLCASRMIAVLHPREEELVRIAKKRRLGKKLTGEEEKKYSVGVLTAELVAQYGKKALMALAGRGIGPRTAARILGPGREDRLTLLRAIAKAEKEYARTKQFWD